MCLQILLLPFLLLLRPGLPWALNPVPSCRLDDTVFLTLLCPVFTTALSLLGASLIAQLVKNPPAMWETWVQSLGWEDPLEKGKATHSSILAWRIPGTI